MLRKIRLFAGISALLSLALLFGAGYYALGTPEGSTRLIRWGIRRFVGWDDFTIRWTQGSLLTGLHWNGVVVRGIPNVNVPFRLDIRQIALPPLLKQIRNPQVIFRSGNLRLQESEPIIVSGTYRNGKFEFNLYSQALDVREIVRFFLKPNDALAFSGTVSKVDLNLSGSPKESNLTGRFFVDELFYHRFSLKQAPGTVDLVYRHKPGSPQLNGTVSVHRGEIQLPSSVIKLQPSVIRYAGNPKLPSFEVEGTSVVQKVSIWASFRGTLRKPDLRLGSKPRLSQDYLLLMLATGRRWRGMEQMVRENQLSLDLAQDFLDFAIFGGAGNRMAERFGIEGSLLVGENTTGVGIRKSLSDRVGVSYGVEQTHPELEQETPATRHKVGADYQVTETDKISLEAESQITPPGPSTATTNPAKADKPAKDEKIIIKYKKKF